MSHPALRRAGNAAFVGFVLLEQVAGDAIHQGEVLGGMAGSFATVVVVKTHVQDPRQFVFDVPVLADGAI